MNAYSVAAELLGDLQLSSDQHAQLRAIDYRFQLEVQRRLRTAEARGALPASDLTSGSARLGPDDLTSLRAMLLADIREMLASPQREHLDP